MKLVMVAIQNISAIFWKRIQEANFVVKFQLIYSIMKIFIKMVFKQNERKYLQF